MQRLMLTRYVQLSYLIEFDQHFLLFRHEFKIHHEEWVRSIKPKLGPNVSDRVWAAINATQENVKSLYNIKNEMRAALKSLLKVCCCIFKGLQPFPHIVMQV